MKERMLFLISILLLWSITFIKAPSDGWFLSVVSGGSATTSTTTSAVPKKACEGIFKVPYKYPTIQSALNAACAGGTVQIGPGTFTEALVIGAPHSGVKIIGAGVDVTVLSGVSDRSISIDSAKDITIQNLTIKSSGGVKFDGGGLWISRSNNILVDNCRILGNRANRGAGVTITHGSSVTIKYCLIDNNVSQDIGSGVLVENSSRATLENVSIVDNRSSRMCFGLGLYAEGAEAIVNNSIIWGNNNVDRSYCPRVGHLYSVRHITNSDIEGGFVGAGNINVNPYFTFSSIGDYLVSLQSRDLAYLGARPPASTPGEISTTTPIIYRIEARGVTTNYADIVWNTDKASDSIIYYSRVHPLNLASSTRAVGLGNTRNHRVFISGLSDGVPYYFIVISKVSVGNTATSTEYSFNTIAIPKLK